MTHRREKHEEKIEMFRLFEKKNCTHHDKRWTLHKNLKMNDNSKNKMTKSCNNVLEKEKYKAKNDQ